MSPYQRDTDVKDLETPDGWTRNPTPADDDRIWFERQCGNGVSANAIQCFGSWSIYTLNGCPESRDESTRKAMALAMRYQDEVWAFLIAQGAMPDYRAMYRAQHGG